MSNALVVGGNSGIGLAVTVRFLKEYNFSHVYIVGKEDICREDLSEELYDYVKGHSTFFELNLINEHYEVFDRIDDIDALVITAGFGRVALFSKLTEAEITNVVKCNELAVIRIIKKYYDRIQSSNDFYCAVMGSIAGHIVSPMFSVYGAAKRALCGFVENVNAELAGLNCKNRILDVSPGTVNGTKFNGGKNNIEQLYCLADDILQKMFDKETLFIPDYNVYEGVISRYKNDPEKFAAESFEYKKNSGRASDKPQVVVGYLSGTFDLFHVGHLNLLKNAKSKCDYLIVGVHRSGSWKGKETFIPFEDRKTIVGSIKYVDEVVESFTEDSDAFDALQYDILFVGGDYKGSERFQRYEEYFKDKKAKIVYFPYTKGISSTQLREKIKKNS